MVRNHHLEAVPGDHHLLSSVLDTGDSHFLTDFFLMPHLLNLCRGLRLLRQIINCSPTFLSANDHSPTSNSGCPVTLDDGSLPVSSSASPSFSNSDSPPVISSGCPPASTVCSPYSDTDYSPASNSSGTPDFRKSTAGLEWISKYLVCTCHT